TAFVGQHRLGAGAVTVIATHLVRINRRRLHQVVPQLCLERALDERLLEGQGGGIHRLRRHWAADELVDQFLRNLRQRRGLSGEWQRSSSSFCLAYMLPSSCHASHTKFRTGALQLLARMAPSAT